MKKILSAVVLIFTIIFSTAPVQAYDFEPDKDFNEKVLPVSAWFAGVVEVSTYLSVRERPSINSREIMRLYNGDKLELKMSFGNNGWWEVYGVNGRSYSNPIGYVSTKYVRAWQ